MWAYESGKNKKHHTNILYLSLHVGSTMGPQATYTLSLGHLFSVRWTYVYIHIFTIPHDKLYTIGLYISPHSPLVAFLQSIQIPSLEHWEAYSSRLVQVVLPLLQELDLHISTNRSGDMTEWHGWNTLEGIYKQGPRVSKFRSFCEQKNVIGYMVSNKQTDLQLTFILT